MHTPTPWKAIGCFIGTDEEDSQTIGYMDNHRNRTRRPLSEDKENAEFIVKAVNNYDELVETLQHLSMAISSDSGDYPDDQLYNQVMEADLKAQELLARLR